MDSDNEACFIEREEILRKYEKETLALDPSQQYLFEAEKLLGELSTPLNADDLFAGRMLEGRWHHSEPFTRIALSSQGHATLPIAKILTVGLKGICRDVSINSENQSPTHGMDKTGPTAVLKSVSRLPLDRCASGGLNLKFAARPSAKVLEGLIKSYMQMGGQHLGFTIVDRATLEDARSNPAAYRNLLVRITGYSEFFTTLSPAVQQEVINRTEY